MSDSEQGPLPPRTRVIWGNREQSDTDLRENGSSQGLRAGTVETGVSRGDTPGSAGSDTGPSPSQPAL